MLPSSEPIYGKCVILLSSTGLLSIRQHLGRAWPIYRLISALKHPIILLPEPIAVRHRSTCRASTGQVSMERADLIAKYSRPSSIRGVFLIGKESRAVTPHCALYRSPPPRPPRSCPASDCSLQSSSGV